MTWPYGRDASMEVHSKFTSFMITRSLPIQDNKFYDKTITTCSSIMASSEEPSLALELSDWKFPPLQVSTQWLWALLTAIPLTGVGLPLEVFNLQGILQQRCTTPSLLPQLLAYNTATRLCIYVYYTHTVCSLCIRRFLNTRRQCPICSKVCGQ